MFRQIGIGAIIVAFGFAGMISSAVPAKATTYDFTLQGVGADKSVSGSGTFTTNAAGTLVISGSGVFAIDGVSGGTTLFPVTADTAGLSSDNVFPIDSNAGLLFEGTSNPNFFANIYAPTGDTLGVGANQNAWLSAVNGGGYLWASLPFAGVCSNCVADVSLTITAATPLPSTWGMMLVGLGVLGFMGYRRKDKLTGHHHFENRSPDQERLC
jgi:PEP-CTERM motif